MESTAQKDKQQRQYVNNRHIDMENQTKQDYEHWIANIFTRL